MTAPDKVWAWCFQVSTDGDWGGWGGYARQTNLHPLDDRERATGAEYTRSDLIAKSPEVQALVDAAKLVFKHNDTYFYGSSGIEKQRLNFNKVGKELRAALTPFTGKESK